VIIHASSDKGRTRVLNEDTFSAGAVGEGRRGIMVVCDGMGGEKAGEVASDIACTVFMKSMKASLRSHMDFDYISDRILDAADEANAAVLRHSRENPECGGMGTTLVAAVIWDDIAVFGNVGDSRAYLINESGIKKITSDHSLMEHMLQTGKITPEEALRHPKRNVITRALGVDLEVICDIYSENLKTGNVVLLCSDGLSGEMSEDEIYTIVITSSGPEEACKRLIDRANQLGGRDNITVAIAAV